MKEIIAIDADDTLFNENDAVREYMNETYGFTHTKKDYLKPGEFFGYWERIWNVEPSQADEMYEGFLASSHKALLPPVEGAIDAITSLKEKYELVIVTSRGAAQQELTHSALAEHFPRAFADVHFVPLWGGGEKATKAKICNEIGATTLIDDNYEHCRLAAEAGVRAILFGDYGWNRNQDLVPGIVRCTNWAAVRQLLVGQ